MHRMAFGKGVGANEEATGCHVGGLSCLVWYHTLTGTTIARAEPDATLARPHQSDLCMVGTTIPHLSTTSHQSMTDNVTISFDSDMM